MLLSSFLVPPNLVAVVVFEVGAVLYSSYDQ